MGRMDKRGRARLGGALERRLGALREEIVSELNRAGEAHYIDLATRVADAADQAMADLIAETDAAIVSRQFDEVRQVLAAQ